MKKKILLFVLCMFLFITNVNAAKFDVDITSIEYKGNNGTVSAISSINLRDKEMNLLFESSEGEVIFDVTMTNSGKKAGTLENITINSDDNMVEYTSNFPSGGLSIDGKGSRVIRVRAKLKRGARNTTYSSNIKLTYNYTSGSCPDGEVLSTDETRCLCPGGKVRNSDNVCATPETTKTCTNGEVYNKTTKKCEKKSGTTPDTNNQSGDDANNSSSQNNSGTNNSGTNSGTTPDNQNGNNSSNSTSQNTGNNQSSSTTTDGKSTFTNPRTLDNIILVSLLFIVSGLGIYAVLFNKITDKRKKISVGILIAVITISLSAAVLATVYGVDKILGSIINPVTREKEITIRVNESVYLTAELDWGSSINGQMKRVAGNPSASYSTEDTSIIYIRRSYTEPTAENKVGDHIISSSSSRHPVYIWFDNGTLYWWSLADHVEFGTHASWFCSRMLALKSVDIEDFYTDKSLYMDYMFYNCNALESLNLSNINTSNVQTMEWMFNSCSSLTSLDLSKFNTQNVTNMYNMFGGCSSLTSLDLSMFNTKKVQNFSWFINHCDSLVTLDVSGFDLTNANTVEYMFIYNSSLKTIYATDSFYRTMNYPSSSWMFYGDVSLVGGKGTVYDSNNTDGYYARIDDGWRGYFTQKN